MALVKTIVAFAYVIASMFILLPVGLPAFLLSFLGLKKPMSWIICKVAQGWANIAIGITGCAVTVQGRENIPGKDGVCFVSNHCGIFDIVLALAFIGRPFGFIAKKELLAIPFLNLWIYLLGGLFIDRKNIRNALKTINTGISRIQKGGGMLIFPEGTRSKGRGLLPFRSGAVKLAINSLAPIVPIAISGSYEVFEQHYRVQAVPVQMVFCPPVNTVEMRSDERRHKLADQVQGIIAQTLNYR